MAIFKCAEWRPVQNHGGAMAAQYGLILHHAVANGSLHGWFDNPKSQVSAHFWVAKDGTIEQYVDSDVIAWHAMQMNDTYCGVETEGCVEPPYDEPMTSAMVDALATLYREGHELHGWPNSLANADGEKGFGFHRMGVSTSCPCDVRKNKRSDILALAFKGSAPPTPKPPAQPSGKVPPLHVDYFGITHNAQHADVRTWQQKMKERGWTITVDQWYGQQSEHVCIQFQTEKDLGIDGLVGPETWDATWTKPIT